MALHTAIGFCGPGLGMVALAWHVETDPAGTPRWLPISVAIGVATGAVGLWQALDRRGTSPVRPDPGRRRSAAGACMAAIFGLTVYLAQRAHTQTAHLQRTNRMLEDHITQRADAERRTNLALDAGQMGTWELDLATDTSVRSLRHDQIFGYATLQPDWGTEESLGVRRARGPGGGAAAFEDALEDRRVQLGVSDPLARRVAALDQRAGPGRPRRRAAIRSGSSAS